MAKSRTSKPDVGVILCDCGGAVGRHVMPARRRIRAMAFIPWCELLVMVFAGSVLATTYTTNLALTPAVPSADWTQTLYPGDSARLTVSVAPEGEVGGETLTLDGPPSVSSTQADPAFAWSGQGDTFFISNSLGVVGTAVVSVACSWSGGSGEIDGGRIEGLATATALAAGVEIEKLRYRLASSQPWTDLPASLYVPKYVTVEFLAISKPAGAAWPTDKPVWSGASGVGEQASNQYNTIGPYGVSVECGNIVSGLVTAVEIVGLKYRIGTNAYVPIPDPLFVAKDTRVDFLAVSSSGSNWPADKPVWTGAVGSTGGSASHIFDTMGTNFLAIAECGNVLTGRVTVLGVEIMDIGGISPPKTAICVTASGFGYTAKTIPEVTGSYAWTAGVPLFLDSVDQPTVSASAGDNPGVANLAVVFAANIGMRCNAQEDVTVLYPNEEATSPRGWDGTLAEFSMQIAPTGTWYGNVQVKEFDTDLIDTCWFPQSKYPPWEHLDEKTWIVKGGGCYEIDQIGWYPEPIKYYRQMGRYGGVYATQIMKIACLESGYYEYTRHPIKIEIIDDQTISSTRDGVPQTKEYLSW